MGGSGANGGNGGLGGSGGTGGPGLVGGMGGDGGNGGAGGLGGDGGAGGLGGNGGNAYGGLIFAATGSLVSLNSTTLTDGSVQGGAAGLGGASGPAGRGGAGGAAGPAGQGGTGSPAGLPGMAGNDGANGAAGQAGAPGHAGVDGQAGDPATSLSLPTTTTTVGSSNSTDVVGQSLTFTATVTSSGATPTGSVEFFDGGTDLGPGSALSAHGDSATSTLSISTLPTGTHDIEAVYTASGALQDSSGTVTQTVNAAPGELTPNELYVSQMYLDTLNRPVDQGGLLYWSSQLDRGMPRAEVADLLTHSAEYFGIVIQGAYHQYLGRAADGPGLAYWIGQMQSGLTDQQLEAAFIGSPEFYQHAGGTDKAWVEALYSSLLGRPPDTAGWNYWTEALARGASRAAVAYGFAASSEREAQMVQEDYQHFLHRSANDAEVAYWVEQVAHGMTNEDVMAGFLASPEYFADSTGV
jgi:hypothetical protein